MRGLTANIIAAIGVATVGAYLQLVEWVDLFPWNDIRRGNGQETLDYILAGVTVFTCIWLWLGGRLAAIVASIALAVWAALQAFTWWIPYFTGASETWKRVYSLWFSQTVSVLPRSPDRLPPDANHLVLQFLILVALTLCLRAAFRRKKTQR